MVNNYSNDNKTNNYFISLNIATTTIQIQVLAWIRHQYVARSNVMVGFVLFHFTKPSDTTVVCSKHIICGLFLVFPTVNLFFGIYSC